ncbi:MAG: hypothetical protein M0D57_02555 [Sphingobacteriales bacterium JAD_PAG50586_3]|nr:MAG: hypothetical protein M0D57_02555 [Sphingobacteriales bacterium JAD_PAG50586_3]
MIKLVWLLPALLLANTSVKPRFIDIEKELNRAPIVAEVVIASYGDSTVNYTPLTDSFSPGALRMRKTFAMPKEANQLLTGCSPNVGDTVLIVSDTTGRVTLFAEIIKDEYRFWSPYFTGSVAFFEYKAPFTHLEGRKEETHPNGTISALGRLPVKTQPYWAIC